MSEFVTYDIKPNLPVLGREYGRFIPKIKEAISSCNQFELAQKVKNGGYEVVMLDEDTELELNSDNLLVMMQGKDGYAFNGEGELGVVLDTKLNSELIEEGYLREVLSKVQNTRKESGFEVMDRINIYVSGSEKVLDVIKKYEDKIMSDTLADSLEYKTDGKDAQEVSINGEKVELFVEKN